MATTPPNSNAAALAQLMENPEALDIIKQFLELTGGSGIGGVPSSFIRPGTILQTEQPDLTFENFQSPLGLMRLSGAPQIQPVQSGNIQFLGGSPIPVNNTLRTAALLSLGTNLLEAQRALQRRRRVPAASPASRRRPEATTDERELASSGSSGFLF